MDQNGVKQYFERYGMRIEVKRETSICNPRLSDSYIYYLVEGIASLTSLTMDGEERVILLINLMNRQQQISLPVTSIGNR